METSAFVRVRGPNSYRNALQFSVRVQRGLWGEGKRLLTLDAKSRAWNYDTMNDTNSHGRLPSGFHEPKRLTVLGGVY